MKLTRGYWMMGDAMLCDKFFVLCCCLWVWSVWYERREYTFLNAIHHNNFDESPCVCCHQSPSCAPQISHTHTSKWIVIWNIQNHWPGMKWAELLLLMHTVYFFFGEQLLIEREFMVCVIIVFSPNTIKMTTWTRTNAEQESLLLLLLLFMNHKMPKTKHINNTTYHSLSLSMRCRIWQTK